MADLLFCSHYPFTSEAREYIRSSGIQVSDDAISLGASRILSAVGARGGQIPIGASSLEAELLEGVISYASSRVVLSFMKNRVVSSRMAVAEAKRSRYFIGLEEEQRRGNVDKLALELGLHFTPSARGFSLPVWEYLSFTPRSIDYKLSNRELSLGMVQVSSHQRLRIIEEAVRKRVESTPLPSLPEYPDSVKSASKEILSHLPREELTPTSIASEDFPPCMLKLIDDLRTAINVPHNGRYALASYLVRAGLSDGQIVKLFQNAPDFNLETTEYQVKYIRSKAYTPPSCATMDTWGICIAECRCGNPMNFRKRLHGGAAARSMEQYNMPEPQSGGNPNADGIAQQGKNVPEGGAQQSQGAQPGGEGGN